MRTRKERTRGGSAKQSAAGHSDSARTSGLNNSPKASPKQPENNCMLENHNPKTIILTSV